MLGASHNRPGAFRPRSIVNISGMSYGALPPVAIEALNRGAALAGALQNTGEGGTGPAHLTGAELVFQVGTGYFGCRDGDGAFSLEELMRRVEDVFGYQADWPVVSAGRRAEIEAAARA